MSDEKIEKQNDSGIIEPSNEELVINLDVLFKEIYKFKPEDIQPNVSTVHYSNLAYIQAMPRDLYIDFLEMPGVKKDGKMIVNTTRIYMPFPAAQRLATVLTNLLDRLHKSGKMEQYTIEKK